MSEPSAIKLASLHIDTEVDSPTGASGVRAVRVATHLAVLPALGDDLAGLPATGKVNGG